MIVRALDQDHDWLFGKGKNDYLTLNPAIAQNINTKLLSFLGDCFFDVLAGIDWFNLLGGKSQVAIAVAVRATILNAFGVLTLTELEVILDAARLETLEYDVTTIYEGSISPQPGFLLTELGDILTTEGGDQILV